MAGSWVCSSTGSTSIAGRKTSAKGKKGLVGSIEMADAALTQSSARALMAGYADSASAASKQAAELRREFGARIETLETGFSTFNPQLQSVDSKMERQHSELLQAVRNKALQGRPGQVAAAAAAAIAAKVPSAAAAAAATVVTTATVAAAAAGSSVEGTGRQPCLHRRGREQPQASLGPVGGSCSPVGAAVDHIWRATAPTRVSLTLLALTPGTVRTCAVSVCLETTLAR